MSIFQPKKKRKLKVRELNANILCYLCDGYLIRPVAVTECLHTFCRSCLVGFLEDASEYRCPQCDVLIHETNPWEMIKEDKTLEDIILKLIPGLWQDERKRRAEFHDALGIADDDNSQECFGSEGQRGRVTDSSSHKAAKEGKRARAIGSSQIGFCLTCLESKASASHKTKARQMKNLDKKFLRCSANITVEHLKKFLHIKLQLPETCAVDILCNGEIMGRHHTLEFIYMTRWRFKDSLLYLEYRPKLELVEA